MKPAIPLILALFLVPSTSAEQLKIAIVDTGLDINDPRFAGHICPSGHKDFTETSLEDTLGHGTFVAGLIKKNAGNSNYCLLIYKYYVDSAPGSVNVRRELAALREAISNGADIVNFSGGGPIFNEEESLLIKYHPEVTFVVAAGNEGKSLDISGNEYYPASYFYPNEIVVGSVNSKGKRSSFSNYGKNVEVKELGEGVVSYVPNNRIATWEGTSFSTAIHTGKLIRKMLHAKQSF
jgi:subtilisin family serine protease